MGLAIHEFRHMYRSSIKTLLSVAAAFIFISALGWMNRIMLQSEEEITRLYETTLVEAEIIKEFPYQTVTNRGGGFINGNIVQNVMESGFMQYAYLEASGKRSSLDSLEDEGKHVNDITIRAFDQPQLFFAGTGREMIVEYGQNWDENLFTEIWTKDKAANERIPILLPMDMLDTLEVSLGSELYLVKKSEFNDEMAEVVVAGFYIGDMVSSEGDSILMPLTALQILEENQLFYVTARFEVDPEKNRELDVFQEEMKELVSKPGAGLLSILFIFWDEELRQVIRPMEKNLSLLTMLHI